jgi:peptidoglycan/LPS O-acetylase OafA/YrhL
VLRIFPTLWLIVAGWALLRVLAGEPPDAATFMRSMLPYPSLEPTLPLVVWTLRFELLFYAVFAIFMFRPRYGLVVFAIWSLTVIVQIALIFSGYGLIPTCIDHDPCAHLRRPMVMMRQG